MIVEPDFLDHWKTRMLARLLKDERAPIYVLRLWAHCQQRKTDRFTDWNPDVLASVCRWDTDGLTLWNAMGQTFLEIDGGNIVVHGWAQTNASLISAWENGKLGGRPRAVNTGVPKPIGNPPVNPPQTDRVTDRVDREEKRREDTTPNPLKGALPGKPSEGDKPQKPKKERKPVERNPVLDALVECCGGDVSTTTRSAWVQAATALRDIKEVSPQVTHDEIKEKASTYRRLHPDWDLTSSALAKHWGSLVERKTDLFDGEDWRKCL
jgi:hypothetical protein